MTNPMAYMARNAKSMSPSNAVPSLRIKWCPATIRHCILICSMPFIKIQASRPLQQAKVRCLRIKNTLNNACSFPRCMVARIRYECRYQDKGLACSYG
uniref:Uncharacterized protein n=1 Tax=Arundo donax TaxID=35708 RepID=A0A0A9ESR3_ARUDO